MMDRVVLHSDCNSFYASVEIQRRPELADKPVSVGGNAESRHGIILASNPAAKKFGVKTGETLWQAKQKCRELIIIPPDYSLYVRFSKAVRKIYLDYTDQVEPFGLDEAWLDVTGSRAVCGDGMKIACAINERVKRELGITVSIGVSYNKVFAKLGSDYKKPDGITCISRANFRDIVFPLPVSDLLYIGRSTAAKLNKLGVYTIGDLAAFPAEPLHMTFGKVGDMLHMYANGEDDSPVAVYGDHQPLKSVGNSTTTARDLENDEDVKIVMFILADSISRRLRESGLCGKVVTVTVRDKHMRWYSHQRKSEHPIEQFAEISDIAMLLFREFYNWNAPIRSVGITISALEPRNDWEQASMFFDMRAYKKQEKLELVIDSVKRRYGKNAVRQALLLKGKGLSVGSPDEKVNVLPTGRNAD